MEKAKCRIHSAKSRNRFALCCCLGSSSSDEDLSAPFEKEEAYDYVVEKLAIKRVPISMFATDEDLAEIESEIRPIESNNLLNVPVSASDESSASVFYTMIQRNNSYLTILENELKKPDVELVPGRIDAESSIQPKIEDELVYKPAEVKEAVEIIKEVIRAQVHREQNEIFNDTRMTPELQETLKELGSKKRPTGSARVTHRTVNRIPHHETNVQDEDIKREIDKSSTLQLPVVMNDSEALPLLETKQFKPNDEVITPENIRPYELTEEQEKPKSNKMILKSVINLSNFASHARALNIHKSQTWKIIIKEHVKQKPTSLSPISKTPDEATEEEETEAEEMESEMEETELEETETEQTDTEQETETEQTDTEQETETEQTDTEQETETEQTDTEQETETEQTDTEQETDTEPEID